MVRQDLPYERDKKMGHIFYLMGKSSSGKDTIFNKIQEAETGLKSVTLYTTRPVREGEVEGETYYFVDDNRCNELCDSGKVVELREYQTVHGIWKYFTVDDEQIKLEEDSYIMIGTLESYNKMVEYYGEDVMIPIYIEIEDGLRLARALEREREQKQPKYAELCRRFLADTEDFKEENIESAKIYKRFVNTDLNLVVQEILLYIEKNL